ncbi:MAG TPA: hypothetical protein VK446_13665 [Methylocystis sp.]|nr:hypothetical protein [Methylocystis sp.]HXZ17344.1 hypothetical protein [Roseiarcus sp.]
MRKLLLAAAVTALMASPASALNFQFRTLDNPGDPTFNQLLGINDYGVIVGYFGSGLAGHPNIGYEIAPPYTTFTPNMQPGSVQTQATGINNSGVTTGFWSDTDTGTDANFAFVRTRIGGNFQYVSTIDPLTASTPRVSQALGINNSNIVVGFYNDAGGASHGFAYNLNTAAYLPITISGASSSAVTGINDDDEICGFLIDAKTNVTAGYVKNALGITRVSYPHAGTTQLLGINNEGVAVGFYIGPDAVMHGAYYTPDSPTLITVNVPGAINGTVLNGINNRGQIVGFYTDAANLTHGVLVTVTP